MSGITFRDRKYGQSLDAGFYLKNGDLSQYQVGDVVGVCFGDQQEKQRSISKHCPVAFGDFYGGSEGFVQVLCVVVQRTHSIVWKAIGRFDEITPCSVVLECKSGYWEDVLRWIVLGEQPDWIPDDEVNGG